MSNYLIELGIIHSLLTLGYWLFLSREQQYAKMRAYLVLSTIVSLIIPILQIPAINSVSTEPIAVLAPLQTLSIQSFPIVGEEDTSIWTMELILWVYACISIIFLARFLINLWLLDRLDQHSRYEKYQGFYVRRAENIPGSFTFFRQIFLSTSIKENREDYEAILKHEKAHATLGHTYDLIFFEFFNILFWWLPSIWYVKNEIKKIHEYQADTMALKNFDADKYSKVLIESSLKLNGLLLASSFHDGLIIQRLKAIKAQTKKLSSWKVATLTSLIALLCTIFACNDELENGIKKMGSQSTAITYDQIPADIQQEVGSERDEVSFLKINVHEKQKVSDIYDLLNVDPEMIGKVYFGTNEVYVVLKKEAKHFDYVSEKSKIEDSQGAIFTIVEEQPEYPGGIDAFYTYIAENMVYPAAARENGIEGKVFVQFTVDKDGSISDVETVKGIGNGCDEEAARVIRNAGKFTPGKQRGMAVRVRMVMPVVFKLGMDPREKSTSEQNSISTGKVETIGGKLKVNARYENGQWTGQVSSPDGDPLPGANIVIAGGSLGTHSDINGDFQLKTDQDKDLLVSFVGYKTVQIKRLP